MDAEINSRDIERALGYPAFYKTLERVKSMIEAELKVGLELITPTGGFEVFSVEEAKEAFEIIKLSSKDAKDIANKIQEFIEQGEKAIVFLVSASGTLDEKIEEYTKQRERAKKTILEALGEAALEKLSSSANKQINKLGYRLGYKPKVRIKPGHKGWSLATREYLFKMVSGEQFGVKLSSDYRFIPKRTRVEIVVWEKDENFAKGKA